MTIDIHPIGPACWEDERPKLMNASEIGSLFGVGFYTLAALTAHKRGLAGLGPDPEAPLIVRGHALEDDAADEIRKLQPTWQITRNTNHFVDQHARIGATPDFLVIDPARPGVGSLQVKVVASQVFRRKWVDGTPPVATPPLGYLLQLAIEMMLVPQCNWGCVGALEIGDFAFRGHVFVVDRHRQAETRLRTAIAEYWQAFDAGTDPALDYERDGHLIALMYPNEVAGKIVDLTRDNAILDLLQRREILRGVQKDAEQRLKSCESEIKAKLGDAETALVPGWRVTFKTQHRAGYTVEPTSFRVLRTVRETPSTE